MSKNRVGKKKNRIRNELQALGIDVENMQCSSDPDTLPTAQICYGMLRHYAKHKKYKSGWAIAQYKNIYKTFPPREWNRDPLMIPNRALMVYVYAAAAAWRKQRDEEASQLDEIKLAQKAKAMQ